MSLLSVVVFTLQSKYSFSVVFYLFRCLVPTRTLQLIIMVCSKLRSFDNSCLLMI